jgi:hypothetical protein
MTRSAAQEPTSNPTMSAEISAQSPRVEMRYAGYIESNGAKPQAVAVSRVLENISFMGIDRELRKRVL